jgi:hypothetical protein
MSTKAPILAAFACADVLLKAPAFAWGPDGHHSVGAIADQLLVGSHAAGEVMALLGGLTLQDAAVWADCAKGIDPSKNYSYQSPGHYPECAIYETPAHEAEMADFVRRNDTNCLRKPTEEICHKQYHYTDVAIQRSAYARGPVGTRDDDVVAAIAAAMRVLKGDSAPAPFNFKDKREALLVLTHYVGDVHQPLHVGAVYLDAIGKTVDPDAGKFDPSTETRGANQILVTSTGANAPISHNLHATWDAVPASLTSSQINGIWLRQAKAVPATAGDTFGWPTSWATETLGQAQKAFAGLTFGKQEAGHWVVVLPADYSTQMSNIKQQQLTVAGARLSQILQAIWP